MLKNTNTRKWHSWIAALLAITSIWSTSVVVAGVQSKTEDSDAIPIDIIQPRYPSKAELEGVEGWVKMQLKIDRVGRPFEVKIVNAMPKGVFEKTSKIAMNKWKFRPKIVSGKAVEQHDVFYTLEFKLAE